MNILIIHGNYPAQFRHLCSGFGSNPNNRTVFLTESREAKEKPIPGIEIAVFEQHRQVNSTTHHYLQATESAVLQGQAVLRSIDKLIQKGFIPQVVIFHGGMGLGLFLKDLLPDAITIGYFEWWFTAETTRNLVQNFDLNMQLSGGLRNLPTLQELEKCDAAVTPTEWQKQQFPELVSSKLEVIFDGIDSTFFFPKVNKSAIKELTIKNRETMEEFKIKPNTTILSYATRGMEPLRGFPEFMRALPSAFSAIENLEVIIAGKDRCAYSYQAPNQSGSWKEYLLEEIGKNVPKEKIHFTGLLDYTDYRELLWRSDLHCYFTHPYVTSWSLFEAAACGSKLLSNLNGATKGILEKGSSIWVDIDNQEHINSAITNGLKESKQGKGKQAKIKRGYDLETNLKCWQALINKSLLKAKNRA